MHFSQKTHYVCYLTTFKYLDSTSEELTKKKMIILIPFELLKLRKAIEKKRTPENLCALQHLITHDILEAIKINLDAGNITIDDAIKLHRLTHKLYKHIYSHYEEMEELNEMTDESLLLDVEIMQKEHEKAMAEKDNVIAEKDNVIAEKDNVIAEKDNEIAEKDNEIAKLKEELKKIKSKM